MSLELSHRSQGSRQSQPDFRCGTLQAAHLVQEVVVELAPGDRRCYGHPVLDLPAPVEAHHRTSHLHHGSAVTADYGVLRHPWSAPNLHLDKLPACSGPHRGRTADSKLQV